MEYRLGWCVIVGSIPIGIVGFLAKDIISGPAPLDVVGRHRSRGLERGDDGFAEHRATQERDETQLSVHGRADRSDFSVLRADPRCVKIGCHDLGWAAC